MVNMEATTEGDHVIKIARELFMILLKNCGPGIVAT